MGYERHLLCLPYPRFRVVLFNLIASHPSPFSSGSMNCLSYPFCNIRIHNLILPLKSVREAATCGKEHGEYLEQYLHGKSTLFRAEGTLLRIYLLVYSL